MNKLWLLCIGFLLRAEVLFWLLELSVHAVKCCAELPAPDKALQTRRFWPVADQQSLKAEASESQCWGKYVALIIESSSNRS